MKKLSKDKRNKVILVWAFILMVGAAWGFGLLTRQLDAQRLANQKLQQLRDQLASMRKALSNAATIKENMEASDEKLATLEADMASGDTYSWAVNTVRTFKKDSYHMDLPQQSLVGITDNTLLPGFPYRQATLTVAGSAFYQDLGRFIADFENDFRFARIINIDIEPDPVAGTTEREMEKLKFKMDLIFPVKPN